MHVKHTAAHQTLLSEARETDKIMHVKQASSDDIKMPINPSIPTFFWLWQNESAKASRAHTGLTYIFNF